MCPITTSINHQQTKYKVNNKKVRTISLSVWLGSNLPLFWAKESTDMVTRSKWIYCILLSLLYMSCYCLTNVFPVLLFCVSMFVTLASLKVTLSRLCLVAVLFWYFCYHISVFIFRCNIDYQYCNHVESIFVPSAHLPCVYNPYIQESWKTTSSH